MDSKTKRRQKAYFDPNSLTSLELFQHPNKALTIKLDKIVFKF